MAEVAVTVVACVIEGPMEINPFACPCCDEWLIVDRVRKLPDTERGVNHYDMQILKLSR
jgi:hypothetical protein